MKLGLIILISSVLFSVIYLYNEGIKLSKFGKEYCTKYTSTQYECPYGKGYCKDSTSFFKLITCPLNDKFSFSNPTESTFFNPLYYIPVQPKVNYNIYLDKTYSKFKIYFNGVYTEIFINKPIISTRTGEVINYADIAKLNPIKESSYVLYDFLITQTVDITKNKVMSSELMNQLKTLSVKYKVEDIRPKAKTSFIFYSTPKELISTVVKVLLNWIPNIKDPLEFHKYLDTKIVETGQLELHEILIFIAYKMYYDGITAKDDITINFVEI